VRREGEKGGQGERDDEVSARKRGGETHAWKSSSRTSRSDDVGDPVVSGLNASFVFGGGLVHRPLVESQEVEFGLTMFDGDAGVRGIDESSSGEFEEPGCGTKRNQMRGKVRDAFDVEEGREGRETYSTRQGYLGTFESSRG